MFTALDLDVLAAALSRDVHEVVGGYPASVEVDVRGIPEDHLTLTYTGLRPDDATPALMAYLELWADGRAGVRCDDETMATLPMDACQLGARAAVVGWLVDVRMRHLNVLDLERRTRHGFAYDCR